MRDFVVAPFFVPKIISKDQKKGLRCKISEFSVQSVKTGKKRSSPKKQWVFSPNEDGDDLAKWKKWGIYHKSVELWFHIIIWCGPKPQNGVTQNPEKGPPSNAADNIF